jgi:hypothetical protein
LSKKTVSLARVIERLTGFMSVKPKAGVSLALPESRVSLSRTYGFILWGKPSNTGWFGNFHGRVNRIFTPKEFQFIEILAQKPNCVVTVEDIIKKVWPENKRATNADVHQYAYILRNKLEDNPHKPKLLITVKGFGYKLCP